MDLMDLSRAARDDGSFTAIHAIVQYLRDMLVPACWHQYAGVHAGVYASASTPQSLVHQGVNAGLWSRGGPIRSRYRARRACILARSQLC